MIISHADFMRRTLQTYRNMTARLAERKDKNGRVTRYRRQIPFTLEAFRAWTVDQLGQREDGMTQCPYCGVHIDILAAVFDHKVPIKRDGGLGTDNLALCCSHCNDRKGGLRPEEYMALLKGLQTFPEAARTDILSRLEKAVKLAQLANRQAQRFKKTQGDPTNGGREENTVLSETAPAHNA